MFSIMNYFLVIITSSVDLVNYNVICERGGRVAKNYDKLVARKCSSVFSDIKWMLELNQLGIFYLVLTIGQIVFMSYSLVRTMLYASLPNERHPKTKAYLNSILKYMEDHYVFDTLYAYELHEQLNRLIGMILLVFLIVRMRSLCRRLNDARANRYGYKNLNGVQMNVCYIDELQTDWRNWIKFIVFESKHKCKIGTQEQEFLRASSSYDRRCLSKSDRIYRLNLIDFDQCYADQNFLQLKKHSPDDNTSSSTKSWWTVGIFSALSPSRRSYVAKPAHRIDAKHMMILMCLYSLTMSLVAIPLLICILSMWYTNLVQMAKDFDQPGASIWKMLVKMYEWPSYLWNAVEGTILLLILASSVTQNCLLALSTLFLASRTNKVIRMLKREVNYQRHHLKSFIAYWESDQVCGHERLSMQNPSKQMKHLDFHPAGWLASQQKWPAGQIMYYEEDRAFKLYRAQVGKAELKSFNERVDYSVDLITILKWELADMKCYFEFFLNINVLSATFASAVSSALFMSTNAIDQRILFAGMLSVSIAPISVALYLGAISEGSFREIYHTLMPLMANDLDLIGRPVVEKIQKISADISNIDVRAFTLMGNFYLTGGSAVSILGWIATINLLLQRFF